MRGLVLVIVAAVIDLSCRASGPNADGDPPRTRDADVTRTPPPERTEVVHKPDPCGAAALGLGQAVALARWTPPAECRPLGDGTSLIHDEAGLRARLECPAGVAAGVDLAQHTLLAHTFMLSPAGAGLVAFDDGQVITLVSQQRDPCPGGPMPMPMSMAAWFLLAAGSERSFADRVCTLESSCSGS